MSTGKQARSGLGLEAQKAAVRAYLDGGNWQLIAEFVEVESGRKLRRSQLDAAIERQAAAKARDQQRERPRRAKG